MYHALLTNRYLTTRVIPLIAVAAVALCVALVIIVVSVMTGFLDMVKDSGRTLMGDVVISYPINGIPHYERLIERLEKLPDVHAATPVIDSWGLVKMPYPDGPNKQTETVQIWGVDPESFNEVTGFADTLYWRPLTEDEQNKAHEDDFRRLVSNKVLQDGIALHDSRSDLPGIVLGMHVSEANVRQEDGSYQPMREGYWWMPNFQVTLTTLPIDTSGGFLEPESTILPVVNEFISGVYLIDDKRVMVPLQIAQRLLHLDEAELLDEEGEEVIGIDPARATMILIRGKGNMTPDELEPIIEQSYEQFYDELWKDTSAQILPPPRATEEQHGAIIQTWEKQQEPFIGPIEKERELMRTLFSLVYLVCAGLVLAIFWAIVYEKTRDIGILRSIGASRLGISWIFLRYGLVVGVLGSIVGLGLAYLVVHNINTIHTAMGHPPITLAIVFALSALVTLILTIMRSRSGRLLPLVLGLLITVTLILLAVLVYIAWKLGGVVIWDPKVYYFTTIPNTLDMASALLTMIGAVLFSLIGAFLPAAKAADTDPVKALRYE